LVNGEFECATGFYSTTNPAGQRIRLPIGWKVTFTFGAPETNSTRREVNGGICGSTDNHVERLGEQDSWILKSQHIESSPEPGKPFDLALYQQVSATVGGAYSLSGWMISLCGGSTTPNDCPEGYYIAKLLGIDPAGGVDPLAASVVWIESRRPHVENDDPPGWVSLFTSTVAQAPTITVFARVVSPFQWHGNHAFVDSYSLIRSPVANLTLPAEVTGTAVIVIWDAEQSPDVQAIPGGNYHLYVDIQVRLAGETDWRDWVKDFEGTGSQVFDANCVNTTYEFRIRARAEQPEGVPGAFPTQRYRGLWSDPVPVLFRAVSGPSLPLAGDWLNFLPLVAGNQAC
jgi:hypothetical protein